MEPCGGRAYLACAKLRYSRDLLVVNISETGKANGFSRKISSCFTARVDGGSKRENNKLLLIYELNVCQLRKVLSLLAIESSYIESKHTTTKRMHMYSFDILKVTDPKIKPLGFETTSFCCID